MVFDNGIPRGKKMCLCCHKFTCQSESPSATNNWHPTEWLKHCIPAQNSETATIEFPSCDNKVRGHKQAQFLLMGHQRCLVVQTRWVISQSLMLQLLPLHLGVCLIVCHESTNGAQRLSLWHDGAFGSIHLLLWCCAPTVWQGLVTKATELELALSFSFSVSLTQQKLEGREALYSGSFFFFLGEIETFSPFNFCFVHTIPQL